MTDPVTVLLASLLSLAVCFAVTAWYLWRNKERILFRMGFEENDRRYKRNSFLSTLITQPDPNRVWGIDESGRWAGVVDWKVTRSRGASFAIIKCSEGTVNSPYFKENIEGAINAGLVGGAYHWLHRNAVVNCAGQARTVWNQIKNYPKILPLIIDLEATRWNGQQHNPNYSDAELFTDEIIRLSGRKPILYSSPGYLASLGPIPPSLMRKLAGVHIAHYGVVRPSFANWLFWQFSPEGDAAHLTPNTFHKKEVDLNYFSGTLTDLRRLAGLSDAPPPVEEPETGDTMQYKVTYPQGVTERAGFTTSSTWVRVHPTGSILNVVDVIERTAAERWGKLENGNYFAIEYNDIIRAEPVDPTPPAPAPAGRVRLTINAEFVNDAGVVTHKKTILIDEPLDAV